MSSSLRIVVPLFEGVNAVDVAGPVEALMLARNAGQRAQYSVSTYSPDGERVATESGLTLSPDAPLPARASGHVLLIPGGRGIRQPATLEWLAPWLRRNHARFAHVVSVCTGAYALAEAGLLDGRRATTHWAFAEALQARYPRVQVDSDSLFLRDERFYTSGGVTAGIDLALELISEDCGHAVAADVARELVVFVRRSGKQSQFSAPLRLQAHAPDRLSEVCRWAASHLQADLSVDALAARARLSARQFSRRFREAFGESPGNYVRRLRVDAARTMLGDGIPPQRAAAAVGFESQDGFRRAFERVLGVTPREYQKRFAHDPRTT